MRLVETEADGVKVVEAHGRLDSTTSKAFGDRLTSLLATGHAALMVDLKSIPCRAVEKKAPPHHKRSGLQSFDKGAIIAGDSGLYASGAGPSCPVIVGWSTRNRPHLPRPINDIP
jgi:hypothetical protein